MFDFRKLLGKDSAPVGARGGAGTAAGTAASAAPGNATGTTSGYGQGPAQGLEVEYERVIRAQFGRLGIASDCVTIEVRRIGHGPHGFDVLVAMVRLHRWERASALKLLLGLPLIESRLRKLVRSTWLADYSHFAGLWLHASEHLHEDPGVEELRELLLSLAPTVGAQRPPAVTVPRASSETPQSEAGASAPHSAPLSG